MIVAQPILNLSKAIVVLPGYLILSATCTISLNREHLNMLDKILIIIYNRVNHISNCNIITCTCTVLTYGCIISSAV